MTYRHWRDAMDAPFVHIDISYESMMSRAARRGGETIVLVENEFWSQILVGKLLKIIDYQGGRGAMNM